jgi:hypothetical protein
MSNSSRHLSYVLCVLCLANAATAAEPPTIPLGVAKVDITPDYPVRLSGYSSRSSPSEGVAQKIWAKALALGGGQAGETALLITVENCGAPASLVDSLHERLADTGLRRSNLTLSWSHSHTAPWLHGFAPFLARDAVPEEDQRQRERYGRELLDKLTQVARDALKSRQPASLYRAQGSAGFAANRRVMKEGRWGGFGVQPDGPVDHRVPILVAKDVNGQPLAVLANYACHCTTLGGDFNRICGDWSGYAQQYLEREHPGVVSMITIGCGADMNPEPRGQLEHSQQHGREFADQLNRLLKGELRAIEPRLSCRSVCVELPFDELPSLEHWEQTAKTAGPHGSHAQHFLHRIRAGLPLPTSISYPVSVWTFGDDLAMVFLAGEVVVDFAIRLNSEFDADRLWITAYANDMPCYIPSVRILREGGYEADQSMIYYGQPTRLAPETEDIVVGAVRDLVPPQFRKHD